MARNQSLREDMVEFAVNSELRKAVGSRNKSPASLESIVHNIIAKVEAISNVRVPTDREMKALQIALEVFKDAPKLAEAIGRHGPFQPTIAATLEEDSVQSESIARLRSLYATARLPPKTLRDPIVDAVVTPELLRKDGK